MRVGRRALGLVLVMMLVAASAVAQSLNPTVTVLPGATAPVPPECADPTAPPIQRAAIEDPRPTPRPAEPVPVSQPAGDLRSELRAAHAAATARNRDEFRAAVTRARAAMATASAAERGAAADAINVFEDVDRLWEYQFNTPTGSFFDSSVQGGALLRSLTKYPGYEESIRGQVIVDANGNRYYPTRESVEFLLGVASDRLRRGGMSIDRRAEVPRVTPRQEGTRSAPTPAPATADRQPSRATTPATSKPQQTAGRSPSTSSGVRPPPSRRTRSVTHRATAQPAPLPPPVDEEPAVPRGVVTETREPEQVLTATAATATDDVVTGTATDTTLDPSTATTSETTTSAAEPSTTTAAQRPERKRSVILPLVLILIGVGVLIVLFRASSN